MAWLPGWDNRIKLTIDHTKIDSALSHFPVTVFLSSTHGDCVFDELTADANRFKIAFTKADGITQLYGEIELWDDGNEKAVIHVSRDGWAISDSEDTIFYMYYDVDHANNTTYIGDIDSTPGAAVWDGNFKAVYHMVDATTSTIKDSTSNNNDGTKKGANEPVEVTGKVGQGQDFDGNDDVISISDTNNDFDIGTGDYTLEVIIQSTNKTDWKKIINTLDTSIWIPLYIQETTGLMRIGIGGSFYSPDVGSDICDGNWNHLCITADRSGLATFYKNGVSDGTADISSKVAYNITGINWELGLQSPGEAGQFFDGIEDEVRFSVGLRSAAWLKATHNSLWDSLLTYGGAELKKQLAEAFSVTDSLLHRVFLAEAFSIIDSWLPRVHLSEAFSIVDSLVKNAIEQLGEAFSVVDSWVARINLSEAFSIGDSFIKSCVKNLADALNIVDSKSTNICKSLNESFTIADSWTMLMRFTETLKVADSVIKKHVITMMIRKIIIRVRGGSYESDIELED